MEKNERCKVKLAENLNWFEKAILYFLPVQSHVSGEGFVLYKKLFRTLYVYAHGHFVCDQDCPENRRQDDGYNEDWKN